MNYNDSMNLNQRGNGGMDNDPMSKGKRLPTDPNSMSVGPPVAMGPVKRVDQGQSDRKGDVCKSSMGAIMKASGLRTQMRGHRDSRHYNENGKTFKSWPTSPRHVVSEPRNVLRLSDLAVNVTEGKISRAVARMGKVWGRGISQNVVWYVVKTCCERVRE